MRGRVAMLAVTIDRSDLIDSRPNACTDLSDANS